MSLPGLISSWPRLALQVAWNAGGPQPGVPWWNDHTIRLQGSWTATQAGRQYELDSVQSGSAAFTLDNTDGLFDSTNPSSAFFGSIKPFRLARLLATWPPTRNLLPQSLATGADLLNAKPTIGSVATAAVAAAPSGQTVGLAWTFPASALSTAACGLGTTNPGYTTTDSNAVPVIDLRGSAVGQAHSFSVYLSAAAGGTAGLTMQARISWYRQDGTRISAVDGTAATVPLQSSWVRATVTSTAPAGAVWARVAIINAVTTSVSNTLYGTGWQWEIAGAPTAWVDPGTTYSLWTGYLERTKQRWVSGGGAVQGFVDLPCVDVLAGLARMTLQPALAASLLALGPTRLYPLDEPSGSVQFRDVTAMHHAATIANSALGAGTVTAGNAITGSGSVLSSGPVVTLANPAPLRLSSQAGSYLNLPAPNGPPTSGGWTRIICFRTTTVPTAGNSMTIWGASAPNFGASSFSLYIDGFQHVVANVTNASNQGLQVAVPVAVCDGNWHLAAVRFQADGKRVDLIVDGNSYTNNDSIDHHTSGITWDTIGCNAVPGNSFYGSMFSGDLAFACEIPTDLVPTLADLGAGFANGWASETSATRAQRILSLAGYQGALTALGTATLMGSANVAGQNAVTALNVVADSEAGQAYADGAGTVTLAGRRWRYLHTTPDIILGENTAAGEVPYLGGDVAVDVDPDHIYNTVTVTNQTAPNSPAQPAYVATNPTSQAEYFASSLPRTVNVLDPNEAAAAAVYLANQYGEPQPRISKVTCDPSANPAMWPALLATGFGSRARLMRRPSASPNVIQVETFVEQLAWKGDDQGHLQLGMQLSAASPYLNWWIIASLHSTLQAQANAGTNTITLGPLTGASLNPARAVLPIGTVLTVGYGTAAAESATVLSVAATTAGYTTVVVTLTANLGSTHASGQTVCQPLPGGTTMPAPTLAGYPASLDAGATLSATGPRVTY